MDTISISKFKATCLALAEVTPPSAPNASSGWLGSLRSSGRIAGDIVSPATAADDWEVLGS
jgi:hypothetical protein